MTDPYEELEQQVQAFIDHGPRAGLGPEAVNSLIENAFLKRNGSYGYEGEFEPNEVVVTEAFDVMKHAEIIQRVNTLGADTISTSSLNWNDLAAAASEGSDTFRTGIDAAMNSGWSGPTADAVRGGVGEYTSSATALSTAMTMISNKLLEAHAGFTQTKAAVPPIVDIGVGASMLESSFPDGLPFADSIKEIARMHDEQEEQARQVMRSVYVPGVVQSDTQVPMLPAALNPVGDSGTSTGGWGLGNSAGGGGGGFGSTVADGSGAGGAADRAAQTQAGGPEPVGTGQAGAGQAGADPSGAGSEQTGAGQSGSLPPADTSGETRAASAAGPGSAGGSTGSGAGNGYGGTGSGSNGFAGPNGSGYGGGAGYAGGSGGSSGAGSGYSGSVLGPPIGSGAGGSGTTGSGGSGSGGSGGSAVASAGRAGTHGMPGMGAMGSRGAGDNDSEHATPGYLVDVSNGSELIGELPLVAPPVLGG